MNLELIFAFASSAIIVVWRMSQYASQLKHLQDEMRAFRAWRRAHVRNHTEMQTHVASRVASMPDLDFDEEEPSNVEDSDARKR